MVTDSFAPFSIIHANAAFHRLSGKKENDKVIGQPFFSLLDPDYNPPQDKLSLSSFMISSSLYLLPRIGRSAAGEKVEPVKCTIRVSPVLGQKFDEQDSENVQYLVIEMVQDGKEFDDTSVTKKIDASFSNTSAPHCVVA